MKWQAFIRIFVAVVVYAHAYAGTIDDCIANFTDQIELLKTSGAIVEAVETNDSEAIRGLGIYLKLGLKFADGGVSRKHKATFEWEMGQIFVDVRELIAYQRGGAPENQVQEFANLYIDRIREKVDDYQQQPAVEVIPNTPKMAGAEYYPVEGVPKPVIPIFFAGDSSAFIKYFKSLGTVSRGAIERRFSDIATKGHLGNVGTISSKTHGLSIPMSRCGFSSVMPQGFISFSAIMRSSLSVSATKNLAVRPCKITTSIKPQEWLKLSLRFSLE